MEIEKVGPPFFAHVLLYFLNQKIGFYQDPKTYTPYNTALTPLGNVN